MADLTAKTDRTSYAGSLPPAVQLGGETIAVVECKNPIYTDDGMDVDEAAMKVRDDFYARLFAESHNLLAGAEAFLAVYDHCPMINTTMTWRGEDFARLRAAVTRVRGSHEGEASH